MHRIAEQEIALNAAALWFLGQAGYITRACGVSVAIDPYLSNSATKVVPEFGRAIPVPIAPADLKVDVMAVTHDHADHLDPETIGPYRHKDSTLFVAPRLACKALAKLGVPEANILRIDSGETLAVTDGLTITGVYAVPTGADVPDTTGYLFTFGNGRTVYHSSDTAYSNVLLEGAPHAEVLLAAINGKYGNLNVHEAVKLTQTVRPRYAIPNHYDLFALNSENPKTFELFARQGGVGDLVRILKIMEPFVWGPGG